MEFSEEDLSRMLWPRGKVFPDKSGLRHPAGLDLAKCVQEYCEADVHDELASSLGWKVFEFLPFRKIDRCGLAFGIHVGFSTVGRFMV